MVVELAGGAVSMSAAAALAIRSSCRFSQITRRQQGDGAQRD